MRAESSLPMKKSNALQPLEDPLACRVLSPAAKDTLGCVSSQLQKNQGLSANGVKIYRKTSDCAQIDHVATEATGRGMLLGISMRDGHRRRILHAHHASCHDFAEGSIYIRDFSDSYRADMKSPFDFVLLEIPHHVLKRTIKEKAGRQVGGLDPVTGVSDKVLSHLACALAPALERLGETSMLFVDQVCAAVETHLVENYGQAVRTEPRKQRILSRSQEARAKELLRSRIDGSISILDIADACHLSRSYFIHAFRETTGQTPHQWLIAQRLERARALLRDLERPLAEIAADCGFADQSHFTRVFTRHVGMPPGHWRRAIRLGE